MTHRRPLASLLAAALLLPAAASADPPSTAAIRKATGAVDDAKLIVADADHANWLSHGRTYSEQRFSPLEQVNDGNVDKLKLAWSYDIGTLRGIEATPIVVDGVMYATGSWSVVFALDARTGKQLWRHDPKVPREYGAKACCDVVNRGVALYDGKVFLGTLDGRLLALDAATGAKVWEKVTVDQTLPYTITGAPRVVKGKVIIGNGGAEFGVRGYISAYDAKTGELAWRTFTIPGDPSKGFESPAIEKAAKTWSGEWWKYGGGGTAWDSMAYDPKLDLLYVGVGNGSPWSRHERNPGGGDNLYLSSMIALDPDDGSMKWHYQTTPNDAWDFTATQHMILADLKIGGDLRPVIMQAPKNGFFYVLDRSDGRFLSAGKYVTVTWAEGIDPETGKPTEVKGQDYADGMVVVQPTPFGGHNWQPMSFSPETGLVYIPAQEIIGIYEKDPDYEFHEGGSVFNTGVEGRHFKDLTPEVAKGHLSAWDPVAQKEVWRVQYDMPWNGGTLATGGNLVFQGTATGQFVAYRATDGEKLWEAPTGTGVIAAPITWSLDGTQYVTIAAGWGGAYALAGGGAAAPAGFGGEPSTGKVFTFALEAEREPTKAEKEIALGEQKYHDYCVRCHGATAISGGPLPDLRKSSVAVQRRFASIVAGGIKGTAMPGFGRWLSSAEIQAIQAYIRAEAAKMEAAKN